MTEANDKPKDRIPEWATEVFSEFLDHQEDLSRVLHLSIHGISIVRGRHEAMTVLSEVDENSKITEKEIEEAAKERDLAQYEVDNGFPLLHEQATVAIWSSLEALVRSFTAEWLAHNREAWRNTQVKKLRVRLGDYESLTGTDRCFWVVDLLDQALSGPLRKGVSRFECLLQPFGLNGQIDGKITKTLYELSQVRHVIVHRRSIADRKLLEACPWLPFKSGERIKITREMWYRYNTAVINYVIELIQRLREIFGVGRYDFKEKDIDHTRLRKEIQEDMHSGKPKKWRIAKKSKNIDK
jgi:hypothetical protein